MAELVDAEGAVVDQVILTFFEQPRSYTAEDVIEICCHGAPVVLRLCVSVRWQREHGWRNLASSHCGPI